MHPPGQEEALSSEPDPAADDALPSPPMAAGTGELGAEEPAPRLTVSAVARRLGVAPATLRTWDRRYGLGPSAHEAGAHRRYTVRDLRRLTALRQLVNDGVTPAEAARVVHALPDSALPESHTVETDAQVPAAASAEPATMPDPLAELAQQSSAAQGPAGPESGRRPAVRGGGPAGPGGRVLALPRGTPEARGLARAAMALDAPAVLAGVRLALARHGVVAAWNELLVPVLHAAGARWAATGEGVEVEHLLSYCVASGLREVAADAPEPGNGRPLLLACVPGEGHDLPLHAVAAALAERGLGTRVLGAALPVEALTAAVARTGAAAVMLWSRIPHPSDSEAVAGVPQQRPPTSIVAAGPGWAGRALPKRVARAETLLDCVELLLRAAGPAPAP